jgi:hypothetical protein
LLAAVCRAYNQHIASAHEHPTKRVIDFDRSFYSPLPLNGDMIPPTNSICEAFLGRNSGIEAFGKDAKFDATAAWFEPVLRSPSPSFTILPFSAVLGHDVQIDRASLNIPLASTSSLANSRFRQEARAEAYQPRASGCRFDIDFGGGIGRRIDVNDVSAMDRSTNSTLGTATLVALRETGAGQA